MAKYTDTITFNDVKTTGMKLSNNIVHYDTDLSEPYIAPFVNAVEIDWNGAQLGE